MKRLALFLVVVLAAAVSAYGLTYYLRTRQPEDQWVWLHREFHLNAAQLARVRALHEAYQPICADHCRRIVAAQQRLAAIDRSGRKNTPEFVAALNQWEGVKHECQETTLRHLQAVATAMNPDDGRNYLALMVPRVVRSDHLEPLGLR
jgi:DNA-binding GntR family transcriptional regulator